jgi:hypothetical protein
MIFTFGNKFDQTNEADYMFIFQIIHWRVQGIPNANWHTFMVGIKERFLCHVHYIQMDICERKWMNALSMLTVVNYIDCFCFNFTVFYICIESGDHMLSNYRHKITKYAYHNKLNALNNIWAMIQKEYWCLIWNMNM